MLKIQNNLKAALLHLFVHTCTASRRVRDKLSEKDGSFFSEHGMTIIITVALAGLIIAFLFGFFTDKVFVGIETNSDDFFNFTA